VRGAILAVAALLLALTAHAAGRGDLSHLGSALPVAAPVAAVSTSWRTSSKGPRSRHFAGPVAVLGVLGASQLAMHGLFTVAERGFAHSMPPVDSMWMTGAHTIAVVAAGLLLVHADALLARLRAAFAAVAPRRWVAPPPAGPLILTLPRWPREEGPRAVLLLRACPRRGPPPLR